MGWRDRLRAAPAANAVAPDMAECAHANSANCADWSDGMAEPKQLAQLAQTAVMDFSENVASEAAPPVLAALRAAYTARATASIGAFDAADVLADRAAVAAEALGTAMPTSIPPADLVDALAEAMAANPVHRITNHEEAMRYFRGMARNRLATPTGRAMAQGLLRAP
ncbi:MAG TPA: hypothetical protein VMV33_17530 [Rhodocyclaceae bacterium]|nr:hypothetical protein [Rhodocyclaceae bacterium]